MMAHGSGGERTKKITEEKRERKKPRRQIAF
jgi:hypothetical protein